MIKIFHLLFRIYELLPESSLRKWIYLVFIKCRGLNRRRSVITTIQGVSYDLDLTQFIDSSIFYKGSFEPDIYRVISRYVKEGMVAVDAGANLGCHTFHLAQMVGKIGQVIAFEPMTAAFTKLKRNAELNIFENIILEKAALGNVSGILNAGFRNSWSLYNEEQVIPETVPIFCLDEYLSINGIGDVDIIKLDVDGYEYKVLQGSKDTLEKNKPLIITEFSNWTLERVGDQSVDFLEFLNRLGYVFLGGKEFSEERAICDLICQQLIDTTINILCVARK
jgi:FkbM family methyltransferase